LITVRMIFAHWLPSLQLHHPSHNAHRHGLLYGFAVWIRSIFIFRADVIGKFEKNKQGKFPKATI
jgi:hypothetical protein